MAWNRYKEKRVKKVEAKRHRRVTLEGKNKGGVRVKWMPKREKSEERRKCEREKAFWTDWWGRKFFPISGECRKIKRRGMNPPFPRNSPLPGIKRRKRGPFSNQIDDQCCQLHHLSFYFFHSVYPTTITRFPAFQWRISVDETIEKTRALQLISFKLNRWTLSTIFYNLMHPTLRWGEKDGWTKGRRSC